MNGRERLTTDKTKIFARESLTIMSITKDNLRKLYNEVFDRLQEYEVAEEEGNIIVPPCKMGDTVYRIVEMSTGVSTKIKRTHCPPQERGVIIPCKPTIKRFVRSVVVTKNNFFDVCENFGESVFPTKEAAKKALRGECEGK